ncbi:MAG: hypothetical protein NTY34_09145 [Candidatus Omnitrophica bacterium]|nr:hypothetical protein [Candidatus Omnitrophota bacterium]
MGKRTLFVAVVIMLSFGLPAAYGLGAGNEKVSVLQKIKNAYNNFRGRQQQKSQAINNEAPKQPPAPAKIAASKIESPKDKEMTKGEMLAELKEDLADNDEVFDAVPELKVSAGQDGNAVYTYKNMALDGLSKEDLAELYGRVRQALVKIRTDRIQRQLETVRRIEMLQKTATPPQLPRIPAEAQPPRIPPAPPSAPRNPPSPPPSQVRR